jgi:DNA-binding transcriptional MerR regulator
MAGQRATKLFYKIGEVSRLADVEPYILRYWESEFPMLAPRKNQGGQRVYQDKDLAMVLDIKRMLHEEGYTIAGARKKLSEPGRGARIKAERMEGRGAYASPEAADVERVMDAPSIISGEAHSQASSDAPPRSSDGTPTQPDLLDMRPGIYNTPRKNSELADALGRFKDEIKGILDLLR